MKLKQLQASLETKNAEIISLQTSVSQLESRRVSTQQKLDDILQDRESIDNLVDDITEKHEKELQRVVEGLNKKHEEEKERIILSTRKSEEETKEFILKKDEEMEELRREMRRRRSKEDEEEEMYGNEEEEEDGEEDASGREEEEEDAEVEESRLRAESSVKAASCRSVERRLERSLSDLFADNAEKERVIADLNLQVQRLVDRIQDCDDQILKLETNIEELKGENETVIKELRAIFHFLILFNSFSKYYPQQSTQIPLFLPLSVSLCLSLFHCVSCLSVYRDVHVCFCRSLLLSA